ncbi:MAG: DUF2322 family protein [Sideroxydans sp.]|nr:DUF2322 family protein [Sideroxydans sp.]
MKKFNDILACLDSAEHLASIALFNADGSNAGLIENKAGSLGSLKLYQHLAKKFGSLSVAAAQEGIAMYAEHTHDAKLHPGKHPNIDRLLNVIKNQHALSIKLTALSELADLP